MLTVKLQQCKIDEKNVRILFSVSKLINSTESKFSTFGNKLLEPKNNLGKITIIYNN